MSSMYAQKNLIYAITDTAISSLLGPNPQVAAMPQTPDSQDLAGATNGLMEWAFRSVNMRRRSALALMDAVLCKRGVFKVSWDSKKDAPVEQPEPRVCLLRPQRSGQRRHPVLDSGLPADALSLQGQGQVRPVRAARED
jgi:hypothetical protein